MEWCTNSGDSNRNYNGRCTGSSDYIGFRVKGLGLVYIHSRQFGVSKRTPFLKSSSEGLQYVPASVGTLDYRNPYLQRGHMCGL